MEHFNLLLATDYSDAATNAERYAVRMGEETNSILSLLHIFQMPVTFPSQTNESATVKDNEEMRLIEKQRLEDHREKLFRSTNAKVEKLTYRCIVREGNIEKEIRNEAEESNADFIILGTHGTTDFRETFLGSHSWHVIKKSKTPVLAIPPQASFTGIKSIVFGTAYREEEFPVLNFLIHIAKQFNAGLTVLHITNFVLTKEFEIELFEKFKHDIESKFSYSKLSVRLMENDDVVDGLTAYCSENSTDILAMSVPKMSLFEKIFVPRLTMTRKMSFHTHVPLLALPMSSEINYEEKIYKASNVINGMG